MKVDGELKNDLVASVKLGSEFTLRAGKKMVRVSVEPLSGCGYPSLLRSKSMGVIAYQIKPG